MNVWSLRAALPVINIPGKLVGTEILADSSPKVADTSPPNVLFFLIFIRHYKNVTGTEHLRCGSGKQRTNSEIASSFFDFFGPF